MHKLVARSLGPYLEVLSKVSYTLLNHSMTYYVRADFEMRGSLHILSRSIN